VDGTELSDTVGRMTFKPSAPTCSFVANTRSFDVKNNFSFIIIGQPQKLAEADWCVSEACAMTEGFAIEMLQR